MAHHPLFGNDEDEKQGPVDEPLTELPADELEVVQTHAIIECQPSSFRRRNGYVPSTIKQSANGHDSQTVETGTTITKPSNEDEQAVFELMDSTQKLQHVIELAGDNDLSSKMEESAVLNSLEDYEAIPLESFGLAMLRGMGHDPLDEATKQQTQLKKLVRRPDLLALGASERPEDSKSAEELRKTPHEKRMEARKYVPVIRVKKIGEDTTNLVDIKPRETLRLSKEKSASGDRYSGRHAPSHDGRKEDRNCSTSSRHESRYRDTGYRRREASDKRRSRSRTPDRDSDDRRRHRSRSDKYGDSRSSSSRTHHHSIRTSSSRQSDGPRSEFKSPRSRYEDK